LEDLASSKKVEFSQSSRFFEFDEKVIRLSFACQKMYPARAAW
jgi:hypothetical protein